MRPCDIMAAKPCPNLARAHALYMRFPLCFHCVLPCASLTFPVFRTQFRHKQASNSIGFAYAQLRETDAKPPLAPIAQLLHARQRSFERSNDLFTFFLSRVHSCTIRLISLFPMTKNARYGRINFRGRLAQRERRCLTSIGSGVQIPHRPPFERTMAARLSSHFLFSHYSNCDINSTSTHSLASLCTTICTTNRTTPRTSTAFLLPFFRYHCPKLTPKEASHAKCRTKARTRS